MRFFDTNALLDNIDEVKKCSTFLISSVTIEELENIKTSQRKSYDVKSKARRAVRYLDDNTDKYKVIVYDSDVASVMPEKLDDTPDNRIMCCAKYAVTNLEYNHLDFVSNDILCRLIARMYFNLSTSKAYDGDCIYKGYKTIKGTTNDINMLMENIDVGDWSVNEYLIIENTDDSSVKELRFDGSKFVALKLPPSKYIKGKNALQRCALDILNNQNIEIAAILGGYGAGKTYLCMQMALYNVIEKGNQSSILGVREVRGEGEDIGFLPGSFEDKTDKWFLPLAQQLNGGEFELESLKQRGVLMSNIPSFMKGTTYSNTIILCDEAEDLTESQVRLVGTRLGENSKIYFSGDYKQSLIDKSISNPLVQMCNEFKGSPNFGCIYLGEDVRSTASRMFADLFTK